VHHLGILAALLVFTTLSFLWAVLPDASAWDQKETLSV